jgi:maltose-binding protein MalE
VIRRIWSAFGIWGLILGLGLGLGAGLGLAGAVAGCAKQRSETVVTLWHSYRGTEQKALKRLVRAFNKKERTRAKTFAGYTPARVRLLQISFDNLPNKITNAVPRGHGPDLFIFAHDRVGDWVSKELVEPIGYWVGPKLAGRFLPKTLGAFSMGQRLYGLPLTYKSVALFYHADLLRAPPRTTEELLSAGRRFMKNRGKGYYGLVYEATDTYFHAPWLFGFGGRFLTRCAAGEAPAGSCKKRQLPIHSPEGVRAMAFARRLAGKGGIVPPEVTGQLVTSLFTQKKAAMAISGPWFISDLRGGQKDRILRVRVAPLPRISEAGNRPAAPLLTVEGIFLSRYSRRKRLAFRVMRALTSDSASEFRLRAARQLPANALVDKKLGDPRSKLHSPMLSAFRQQLDYARPTPKTPFMRVIWEPYKKALAAVIGRGEDPDVALKRAAREIRRVLGSCLGRKQ